MVDRETLVNAVIGGIVAVVTSFLPLSPVLGGAVAGYLDGGDRSHGLRVGVLAGLVALVPMLLGVVSLGAFGAFVFLGVGPHAMWAPFGLGAVFFVIALFVTAVYTVGLSALGGWLGNYVKHDTDVDV